MNKFIKKLALIGLTGVMLSATAITSFACGGHSGGRGYSCSSSGCALSQYCTDANGDGICDNRGNHDGCSYVDANGDGICDHINSRSGRGYHHR